MKREDKVNWVYNSANNQELAERYNVWSKDYDNDLDKNKDYVAPRQIVDVLTRYLPQDAKILDAGVGTGLVGQVLSQRGYLNLEGMDLSPGMLAKAAETNLYSDLSQQVMGNPLDFPSDIFDGIVSVGVLTYGHAPSSSFDELIRITKPGGYIIFTLRPDYYELSDFKDKMSALESLGKWHLISREEKFKPLPILEPDVYFQVWVYCVG